MMVYVLTETRVYKVFGRNDSCHDVCQLGVFSSTSLAVEYFEKYFSNSEEYVEDSLSHWMQKYIGSNTIICFCDGKDGDEYIFTIRPMELDKGV